MLGYLILETAHQPDWRNLLGLGAVSDKYVLPNGTPVGVPDPAMRLKVCLPATSRMNRLAPALQALGYTF